MLKPEKHCEMLSANVRDRIAHMNSGFRLFVQLFSALVGGAIALKAQALFLGKPVPADFVFQSNLLAGMIAVASLVLVGDSFRSWYRQRTRLTEVAGENEKSERIIPGPDLESGITITVFVVVIVSAPILFWAYNPLS